MQRVQLYTRQSRRYKIVPAKASDRSFPPGTIFVLRYNRGSDRCWETLKDCNSLRAANLIRADREKELIQGTLPVPAPRPVPVTLPVPQTPTASSSTDLMLDAALDGYLAMITTTRSANTAGGYRHDLMEFYRAVGNKPLSQITRDDFYKFIGVLKQRNLSARTLSNRCGEVTTLLRWHGIKEVTVKVKYTEKKVRAYRPDELKAIFRVATTEEWQLFQFILGTGARKQEVATATWKDIDFVDGIFTIREHPEYGFKPKDFEEREIPLHDDLVAMLKERRKTSETDLIFPNGKGQPDHHFWRKIKALAKRAGINVKMAGIHVFRKTYATLQHRAGVDARTIQKRLGHSSLETTLAYLEGEEARSDRSKEQVNTTFSVFSHSEAAPVN